MLDPLFTHPTAATRLRGSPLGPWLDSFTDRLVGQGYTASTGRSYVVLAADLGRWMAEHEILPSALDESVVDVYLQQRETQRARRRAASLLFLQHFREEGVVPPRKPLLDTSPVALLCERYAEYLQRERGVGQRTVEGYVALIRDFLRRRFGVGMLGEVATLTVADIGDYLVEQGQAHSPRRVGSLATTLRSFFRFLFAQGETPTDLSAGILTVRTAQLASIPRYLPAADVEKLLDACDLATPGGRRDNAILLLLARLGLRAGEVVALELDDVRWRSGEIVIRGKGSVTDRLPLLPDVGAAIARYLVDDRPKVASRRVFLRLCAPLRGFRGSGTVRAVVGKALDRAGLHPAFRGAHLLRHSLGTRMIREGASLAEIAEVLRHRSVASTEIYAKVDFQTLRSLAQPWPCSGGAR